MTYTPDLGFTGIDTFTYTISDEYGATDTATVTVTVLNTPPVAVDDTAETKIGAAKTVFVLSNDIDPDGHDLTVTGVATPPSHGLASVVGNTITYIPNSNYIGTDTFTYTISDGHGGTDAATVTVTVLNTPPVAVDDTAETNANTAKTVYVLLNDGDEDGHPLTVTGVSDPANGTAVINPGGTVTYTPDDKFTGTDTFTYTVSDGKGGTDTATVTVTVLNIPPVAVDDSAETNANTAKTITVLSNDSDADGHTLTVTGVSDPEHGTAVINPDGTVTYTPEDKFTGTDTFIYTVSDGHGGTDTATVTVTVLNTPPVAADDTPDTAANTPAIIDVLSNDSDADDHDLTVTGVSDPESGTAVINPDGTVTYTPEDKFTGTDTFTYTVSDGHGGTDTATVTVTVTNTPPDAFEDGGDTTANTPVILDVLSNDSDPDGHDLTVTDVSDPANGTAVINPDGTVTYTPDDGFTGEDTFTYTVSDGHGGTATVTVTVRIANAAPAAVDDSAETETNTPVVIDVLPNDSDPDGHALTVSDTGNAASGTVKINPDGTVTYTPDSGFKGTDTFIYTISDGHGGTDDAAVTVTVRNAAPNAVDDKASAPRDTSVAIAVLANDTDANGDALTVIGVTQPANGTAEINPDGTVTYTPRSGFKGTDTFTYTISDGDGKEDTATVTVTVSGGSSVTNTLPDALDDSANTTVNTPVAIAVLANDTDANGDALTVIKVTQPANGAAVINPGGTVTYTPHADYTGTDTFTYTISDGHGGEDTATVTVTVYAVVPVNNTPPEAVNDSAATMINKPVAISVLSNDTDINGDTLTVTGVTQPSHGAAVINPGGTVTYTPEFGFIGTDVFTYTISDGHGGEDTATVTVTVSDLSAGINNVDPRAADDSALTQLDTPVEVFVLVNDKDEDGDPLEVTAVTQPENGAVVINPGGTVTYTPNSGFTGTDTFTYTISDGHGGTDTATVTVTVYAPSAPANIAPEAADDSAATEKETPVVISVLVNDKDANGDPLEVTDVSAPENGAVVINPDGTVTYTPDPGFTGEDTFTYTVSDGNGGEDTATVTVTVYETDPAAPNIAPEAADDSAAAQQGEPVTIPVLVNDKDENGDPLEVTDVSDPEHGTAVINPDGTITYTPDPGFTGEDTFTYTVSDGNGGEDTATVTVTVDAPVAPPANIAPEAADDSAATKKDTPVTIPVLVNDKDENGDPLEVTDVSDPEHGTAVINPDGTVTYTPDPGFTGEDTFTYTVSDGNGDEDTATVTVEVYDTNPPVLNVAPEAADDSAATPVNKPVAIAVLSNDTDGNGDMLTVTGVSAPSSGTAEINSDGTVTYTPDPDFTGTDSFTYTISDGYGGEDTATVTVTVYPVTAADNTPPVAVNDAAATPVNTAVDIPVLSNDWDDNGELLVVTHVTQPAHGTAVINPDGAITYTPGADYTGTDLFTYTITDPYGASDTAIVTVTVYAIAAHNTTPKAADDSATVKKDEAVKIPVLSNDTDADGDTLTVTNVTQPENGTAEVNPDGTITYTPRKGYSGTDIFTYTISDGKGGFDTATVKIKIEKEKTASFNSGGGSDKKTSSASQYTPVEADVAVTIEADKNKVKAGDTVTITVTYGNKLDVPVSGTVVTVALPAGFSLAGSGDYTLDGRTLTQNIGLLAGKTVGQFTLPLTVGEGADPSRLAEFTARITGTTNLINLYDDVSNLSLLVFAEGETGMHERYIKGYPDGLVKPDRSITRAEIAAIFARIQHLETQNSPDPGYGDVPANHWAWEYIRETAAQKLFVGDGNNAFRPDDAISRAELATVIGRYLGAGSMANAKPLKTLFSDTSGHWAEYNVAETSRFSVIKGYEDMTFRPDNEMIRSEAIAMINRMLFRGPLTNVEASFPDMPETHWAFGDIEESTRTHEYRYNADGSEFMTKWIDEPLW